MSSAVAITSWLIPNRRPAWVVSVRKSCDDQQGPGVEYHARIASDSASCVISLRKAEVSR
ncbi:MAG TPA: hypothetical protein VNF75_07170 [Candidatus Dormibacteraeota bacterium]|nr:hypothetical protein [Candidatus Dormibacteraeota bacterium]